MAFRLAGVSVPGPSDVLGVAQAAAGWSTRAVETAAGLPERLATVLDEVEHLIRRITAVADRADELVERASAIVDRADTTTQTARTIVARAEGVIGSTEKITETADRVVHDATEITARAGRIVEDATTTTAGASEILAVYKPIAEQAAPLAKHFVDEFSQAEVQAAIRLVDQLPALTESMERDIMPILVTLDRVGPDVHELLEVLKDVRQAITGIPGFGFFRKRGEEKEAELSRTDPAERG